MYTANQGNLNLPVSPYQPDQSAFVPQGLPMQPPFVPNLPVQGPLGQFVPQITGFAMFELQNNAQRNPLRTFTYNWYSRNRYNNEDFMTMLGTIVEMAQFLIATQNMTPEQAIPVAAGEVVSMLMALSVSRFPDLQGLIPNPQVGNEILQLQQMFTQLQQQIRAFKQGGVRPTGWNAAPANTGGWPPATSGGHGTWNNNPGNNNWGGGGGGGTWNTGGGWGGHPPGTGSGVFHPNANANAGAGHRPANTPSRLHSLFQDGPTSHGGHSGGGMNSGLKPRRETDLEELTMGPEGEYDEKRIDTVRTHSDNDANDKRFRPLGGVAPKSRAPARTQAPKEDAPTHISVTDQEWPKVWAEEGKPYDSILYADGSEQRPAFKSGWKLSYSPDRPYPMLFDPATHMLFHIRHPDGEVIEHLMKKTAKMEYLEHELNARLREQHKLANPDPGKQVFDWDIVRHLKPLPNQALSVPAEKQEESSEDTTQDMDRTPTPVALNKVLQVHTPAEADMKVNYIMPEAATYSKSKTPVEYYYDVVTPYNTDANLINTVKALGATHTLEDCRQALINAFKQHQLPEEVYGAINDRLTRQINLALPKNLGVTGWRISNFVEDYVDLVNELNKDFGPVVTEALQEHGKDLIVAACSVLSGESYHQYLKSLAGDEIDPEKAGKLLVFRQRCSTTRVPWRLDELTVLLDVERGSMVPASTMPNLFQALQSIIERTSQQSIPFAHRFLMTEDGQLIELRIGYLGEECYLLSKWIGAKM